MPSISLNQTQQELLHKFLLLPKSIRETFLGILKRASYWEYVQAGLEYWKDKLNRSIRTIRYHLDLLKGMGLIEVIRVGRMEKNEYLVPEAMLELYRKGVLKVKNCRSHCRSLLLEPQYIKNTKNTYGSLRGVFAKKAKKRIHDSHIWGKILDRYENLEKSNKEAYHRILGVHKVKRGEEPFNPVCALKMIEKHGCERVNDAIDMVEEKVKGGHRFEKSISSYLNHLIECDKILINKGFRKNQDYWREVRIHFSKIPFKEYGTGIVFRENCPESVDVSFHVNFEIFKDILIGVLTS